MVEIVVNSNQTVVKTNDIEIHIEGSFELKKEGAEAPIINVIANKQKEFEQLPKATMNV